MIAITRTREAAIIAIDKTLKSANKRGLILMVPDYKSNAYIAIDTSGKSAQPKDGAEPIPFAYVNS